MYDGIRLPVMHVSTNEPAVPIRDDDVIDLTRLLTLGMHETGVGTTEEFCFLHDLRFLWPKPSRVQLSALIKFVATNKKAMDNQLKCIAIIVASPVVRKLLNFFIWMFRPAQPTRMMGTLEEGFAFLRENCPAATPEGDGGTPAPEDAHPHEGAPAAAPAAASAGVAAPDEP